MPLPTPWTGVKAVADTLSAMTADAATPIVLGEGLGGAIYVQWGAANTTYLTRFTPSGLSQRLSRSHPWRGGHGVAVPTCVYNNVSQDCPMLPYDSTMSPMDATFPSAPELLVMDCGGMESSTNAGGTVDFSPGSTLGALIPAGGTRMFLAAKYNEWIDSAPMVNGPWVAGPDSSLVVTPVRANACAFQYAESELYAGTSGSANDDGYTKGRLLSLGLPSTFTVTAATRVGSDSMAVAGTTASNGHPWVVTVDDHFALAHQSTLPIGGTLASTTTGSVAVDVTTGSVFVCGTTTSLVFLPFRPPVPHGWIAQADANLTGWQVISEPTLIVRGCAVTPQGSIVASGTYSGTFNGQAASGSSDMFVALFTPGAGAAPPVLAAFTNAGSTAGEVAVSPPFVTAGGKLFVAGITQGNWGAASGSSAAKVFVARFDPVTLALQ